MLPPLPRINKVQVEKLKSLNKTQIHDQPWTLEYRGSDGCSRGYRPSAFQETKNRMSALILLDSNFEIALKEFIVHREDLARLSTVGKNSDSKAIREATGRDRRSFAKGDNPQETTD